MILLFDPSVSALSLIVEQNSPCIGGGGGLEEVDGLSVGPADDDKVASSFSPSFSSSFSSSGGGQEEDYETWAVHKPEWEG